MIQIEYVAPAKLAPASYNPRKIDPSALKALERGITEFGLVDPIIARRSDGLVIGGHQRLKVAQKTGLKEVPVVYLDVTDQQAAALNVLLNNPKAQGDWDFPKLADVLKDLGENGFDATLTGFEGQEIDQILAQGIAALAPDDMWKGTPEFVQEDKTAFRQIIVSLPDAAAVEDFAELIGQNITSKTRSVWFPKQPITTYADKNFSVDES